MTRPGSFEKLEISAERLRELMDSKETFSEVDADALVEAANEGLVALYEFEKLLNDILKDILADFKERKE